MTKQTTRPGERERLSTEGNGDVGTGVAATSHEAGSDALLAWQNTWEMHQRWLRTVVYARLGEMQAVEDVMQNVALAAAKGMAKGDVKNVAPWLYQVAIRQVMLYRRAAGRRRKLLTGFAGSKASKSEMAYEPLGWLLAKEQQALVRKGLHRLPEKDAEILLLKYTEGWSYQQLANHLGLSVSAIEARLHRARSRLRALLTQLDPTLAKVSVPSK